MDTTIFRDTKKQVKKELDDLRKQLSVIDREMNDTYHAIEVATLSHVSISHKLCSHLKSVLVQRRKIKNEITVFQSFFDRLLLVGETINNCNKNNMRIEKESHVSLKRILK